jgi:hypothetical protein
VNALIAELNPSSSTSNDMEIFMKSLFASAMICLGVLSIPGKAQAEEPSIGFGPASYSDIMFDRQNKVTNKIA